MWRYTDDIKEIVMYLIKFILFSFYLSNRLDKIRPSRWYESVVRELKDRTVSFALSIWSSFLDSYLIGIRTFVRGRMR